MKLKLFLILLQMVLGSYPFSVTTEAATKLAIGYSTINPRIAPLWIGQELGYFQKYDLEPTLVFVRSTPILIASLKTGSMPVAYGGAGAILGASVGEADLKIVATFTGKLINNLVARPGIKAAKDLRNKTVGVQSIGGTNWIGSMLWLEHLGLDPSRDKINIQVIGDQTVRAQALEAGKIDAASVDTIFSKRLEQRGFVVLGDPHKVDIPFVGVDIVSPRNYLVEHPLMIENVLKALLESLAYVVAPKNRVQVLDVIMKRLRVSERGPAEEGYQDMVDNMSLKPYPSVEGLRNIQRLTQLQNPKIAQIKVENLVDSRFVRKLDESGFLDRLHLLAAKR